MVRPMKNASTISLMIHEFVFIQCRALGRTTVARLPSTSTSTRSTGNASRSRLRRTKGTPSAHGSQWFSRLGGKKGNCEDGHDRDRSSEKVRSGITLPSDAGGEKYCGHDLRASDHHKRQWQNRGHVHVHVPSCLPGGSTASNATWMSALPPGALFRSRALTARARSMVWWPGLIRTSIAVRPAMGFPFSAAPGKRRGPGEPQKIAAQSFFMLTTVQLSSLALAKDFSAAVV